MEFEARLIQIIEQASSPSSALATIAAAIAEDMLADACSVLLLSRADRLTFWTHAGEGLEVTRDAAEAAARESLAKVAPVSRVHGRRVMLAAPLLARAQSIGVLIVERGDDQPYDSDEIRKLVAIASHVVGVVESARLLDMIAKASDHEARDAVEAPAMPRGERTLPGIAASPGIVIGRCAFRQNVPRSMLRDDFAVHGAQRERERLHEAIDKTRADLKRLQSAIAGELGEECALVFAAHLLFLGDPMLLERIERGIAEGYSAAVAVDRAQGEILASLNALESPYFRERVEDVQDLCSRLLSHLLGDDGPQASTMEELVVCRRFTPSLVVELHGRGAVGIASELGGATSHAVLLARALGFPAVTGVEALLEHATAGEPLVIDGDAGRVVLSPSQQTLIGYRRALVTKEKQDRASAAHRDLPSVTADGMELCLRANVAFGVDIQLARANRARGIGLYRTEFPFLVRDGIPTLEEQCRIYAKAYQAFPDDPIVFRILDLAADKLLPGSGLSPSRDAFAGYRSIRLLFDHPHVLRDQVQAFALAAAGRPLSLLIPMVSSVEDLRRMKQLIADALAGHPDTADAAPRIGVLIEVPAAVEIAAELVRESDFVSIGTNDLIQYALVVDRDDPRVSTPRDAYHPAVLRMIRRVVQAGTAAGKEVSVCGELASRVGFASALLALGVDTLSVTPRAIPQLKQGIARVSVARVRDDLPHMLALATAMELEQAISAHVDGDQPAPTSV